MADFDASFYSTHCQDDSLSRYLLKRKPSSDSLRARLETLVDPDNPKRGKQNTPKSSDKLLRSPRLVRISRNILKIKPRDLKKEEVEIKKITAERLFWHKQHEKAEARTNLDLAHTNSVDGLISNTNNGCPITELIPTTCLRPKHLGIQQLTAIRDQIQSIKQDLIHRHPELPSPKPDDWFREQEEIDTLSDINSLTKRHRRVNNLPHKSRVLLEKGVGSIQRQIKSIKLKTSQSSPLDLNGPAIPREQSQEPIFVPVEPASQTTSSPPSLTSFTSSLGTPDTDISQTRLSSPQVSPNPTNQFPSQENNESPKKENNASVIPHPVVDRSPTASTPRPTQLSIVTQGLPESGSSNHRKLDYISPQNSSVSPQWQNSAKKFLANDSTGQIDRWVFSSSLLSQPSNSSPPSRPSHRLSLDASPREFSETRRLKSEVESRSHQAFLSTGHPATRDACDSRFGVNPIIDPLYFIEKQGPSQIILVTDVLIEQQGGLSFLGQEKFNERFRSEPWQTVKTIRQYDRPGHSDAEYLPDVSRVAVVQTPHSPETFPLPTPEWNWLTEFVIDQKTKPVDSNGWEYYDVFSRKWSPKRHGCRTFIRRRRWVRVRGKLDTSNLADPAQADFHTARVSPAGDTADPIDKRTVVILKKSGVHQSIIFNSLTIEGGHLLTIDFPGLPSLDFRWDDSSLVAQNPLFSGQVVANETLRYLQSQAGSSTELANQDEIMECLKDHIARINLQRVTKILTGLSEPQKVNLWRYWLECDALSDPSTKPDADDIWRVVERHVMDVLGTFVFDFYRVKFMNLVVDLYSRSCNASAVDQKPGRSAIQKNRSVQWESRVTSAVQRPTKHSRSRPTLSPHTFLKSGESPSFLDLDKVQLEYWNNLINLFIQPTHLPHRLPFVAHRSIRNKLSAAKDIRVDLQKALKIQNKLKRAATTAR